MNKWRGQQRRWRREELELKQHLARVRSENILCQRTRQRQQVYDHQRRVRLAVSRAAK